MFKLAFTTVENMLVCAPTGAGKTNVAMLALLQLVGQHVDDDGVLNREAVKAVYVERRAAFPRVYSYLTPPPPPSPHIPPLGTWLP